MLKIFFVEICQTLFDKARNQINELDLKVNKKPSI